MAARTVTILFTDIEGSTRLWEAYPDAMRTALSRHDALLRRQITEHGGRIVKTTGDGVHAVFDSALAAVQACVAAQQAVRAAEWPETGPLRLRMALHTGEAEERDGDFFGPAVNRAARLLAAAHGGQILLSAVAAELAGGQLPAGLTLRDLGWYHLRDLAGAEHIFQLGGGGLPSSFPALRTVDVSLTNLPAQPTHFVGRQPELAEVRRLSMTSRLLTLTGAAGAGKTRLSLEAAAGMLDDYAGGVWLVELAPLTDQALVPQRIAAVLEVREQPGQPLLQTLQQALQQRRLLLVLDNCEHVLEACGHVADSLLRACPAVHLLATSRGPLHVAGETVWPVPPLGVPPPAEWAEATAEALQAYAGVQLFAARAMAALPTFALTDVSAPAVAEVCGRLEGIPLAIELAAARVTVLSVRQIADRLNDSLALLTRGNRQAEPRHQALRAALDWSHTLLAEPQQALLRRLSVFSGAFLLETAEAVCAEAPLDDRQILDLLSDLVDQSLVVVETALDGARRFRLLEVVRQYGQEKLEASAETDAYRDRHLAWYQALAEQGEAKLKGPEQAAWLERLEREHDNLRAALEWSLSAGRLEAGLRLAAALHWFWDQRGYLSEGLGHLQALLQRADVHVQVGAAAALPAPPASFRVAQAYAVQAAATLAFDLGEPDAPALAARAVQLFREADDPPGLALALLRLGFMQGLAGELERGRQHLAEAQALAADVPDPWLAGLASMVTGQAALFQGDYARARAQLEQALVWLRPTGDRWTRAHVLGPLGMVELVEGRLPQARAQVEESLSIARALRDTRSTALFAAGAADVARCQGDYERAAELYHESFGLYRRLGNQAEIPALLHNLAYVELGQGNLEAAQQLHADSLRRQQALGNPVGIAEGLAGLAALALARGQPERAARLFGAAQARRAEVHAPVWPAERIEVDRHLARLRAQLDEARLTRLLQAGGALAVPQAIAYALQDEVERASGQPEAEPAGGPPAPAGRADRERPGGLTAREREVAALIARGRSNRAIAEALVITERTAERHVANILSKLGFHSRAEIAAWAVEHGLTAGQS